MYETGEAVLFFIVFLSQVLLISWFYPRRVIGRRRHVLQTHPPSTHPKLYPQPVEFYERRLRNYARLNLAIVVAGVSIIVGLILGTLGGEWDGAIVTPWSTSGEWDAAIVTPFFLVQMVAVVYLELSSFKHHKAMAKAAPPRVRTTELRRRRLVDFVSPPILVTAVLTNVAYIVFLLYYRRFGFEWYTAAGNIALVAAMFLLLSAIIGVALRGPRSDHYQAYQDRLDLLRLAVKQIVAIVIAMPVALTIQLTIKLYDPEFLEPVIASLHMQIAALVLLWPVYSYRLDKVDFDVYRQDPRDSTAAASTTIASPQAGGS
jgi:MFS family permease